MSTAAYKKLLEANATCTNLIARQGIEVRIDWIRDVLHVNADGICVCRVRLVNPRGHFPLERSALKRRPDYQTDSGPYGDPE